MTTTIAMDAVIVVIMLAFRIMAMIEAIISTITLDHQQQQQQRQQ